MEPFVRLTLEKIEFFGESRAKALFKIVNHAGDDFEASVYIDIPKGASNVIELAYAKFSEVTHKLHQAASGETAKS